MPANTTVLQLPYPLADDTVDVPRDVKALAEKIDGISSLRPPLVTALPGGAAEGTEIYLRPAADANLVWHLRRTAAQWLAVGAQEWLRSTYMTDLIHVPSTGAWGLLDTPEVVAPWAGKWHVRIQIGFSGPEAQGSVNFAAGVVGKPLTGLEDVAVINTFAPAAALSVPSSVETDLTLAANDAVRIAQLRTVTARAGNRRIHIRPVALTAT